MKDDNEIVIRILPQEGRICVEENDNGVISRKGIDQEGLLQCFKDSLKYQEDACASGFLPLNTLAVCQRGDVRRFTVWHPRLYADVSLYDTPYPHFPIPRLVFSFALSGEGKVSNCRLGVVADETPAPETVMYRYPFSNVSGFRLCVGANTLPSYKKQHKAHNLPAFLLSIPNNMHSYSKTDNKLGMDYRELMEHLKDKDPSYYYTDVLIPNGLTLQNFIDQM